MPTKRNRGAGVATHGTPIDLQMWHEIQDRPGVGKRGALRGFHTLLFLDEAAIWLTQPNTYTWRLVGCPMKVPTSKARGITARLNLMGCVDFATREVQYREIDGNTTGKEVGI